MDACHGESNSTCLMSNVAGSASHLPISDHCKSSCKRGVVVNIVP